MDEPTTDVRHTTVGPGAVTDMYYIRDICTELCRDGAETAGVRLADTDVNGAHDGIESRGVHTRTCERLRGEAGERAVREDGTRGVGPRENLQERSCHWGRGNRRVERIQQRCMYAVYGCIGADAPESGTRVLLQRHLDCRMDVELMRSVRIEERGGDDVSAFAECIRHRLTRASWTHSGHQRSEQVHTQYHYS